MCGFQAAALLFLWLLVPGSWPVWLVWKACASWLVGEIGACPMEGGAGSCSSGVQGCGWVGLHYCPVGCLAWGIPALESKAYWVGSGLGIKMAASRTAHTNEYSPVLLPPVFLSWQWATAIPNSLRDRSGQAGRSGPVSCEVTAFTPGAWSAWDLVCALQECCLFLPVLWSFLDDAPLTFKAKCSEGSSSWCQIPDVGLRILTPVGEPLWYYFPVCGSPTWWVCDLIVS